MRDRYLRMLVRFTDDVDKYNKYRSLIRSWISTNPQMTGICRTILNHVCTPIIRACIDSTVPAYILDACALNPFDILKPCMTGIYLHIVRAHLCRILFLRTRMYVRVSYRSFR